MKTILAVGEALIDFIPDQKGKGLANVQSFTKKAGGAPANVAAGVAKLGGKALFLSQVGKDGFGEFLKNTLDDVGVNTQYMQTSSAHETSLAFVALDEKGERDFIFYRKNAADLAFDIKTIDLNALDYDYVHFCSVSLVPSLMKDSHQLLLEHAKKQQKWVSFDPNLRLNLWPDVESCIQTVKAFIPYADILKISDDELELIFKSKDVEGIANDLLSKGLKIFVYTMGDKGARVYTQNGCVESKGRIPEVVDTTGAGDSFIAAFLYQLSIRDEMLPDNERLKRILEFANHYASVTISRFGAIEAMATHDELLDLFPHLHL